MTKLADIDVSLSRGQLYGKKQYAVVWIAVTCAILLIFVGLVSLVFSCIDWDWQIFVTGIICTFIGVGFLVVLIYSFQKDKKTKELVSLWMKDAIKVCAIVKKIDSFRAGLQPIGVKIVVEFNIDNISYMRESSVKPFGAKKGYSSSFKKYVNKDIQILYSPKYDEVLFLK